MSEEDEIAAWLREQAEADLQAAEIISAGGFEPQHWDMDPPGRVNAEPHPGSAAVSIAVGEDPRHSPGWVPVYAWDQVCGEPPDDYTSGVAVIASAGRGEYRHVIRHDPRSVAARAESVLAVLDDYAATLAVKVSCEARLRAGERLPPNSDYLEACRELAVYESVVRRLACGYRSRDGYRPEWKP